MHSDNTSESGPTGCPCDRVPEPEDAMFGAGVKQYASEIAELHQQILECKVDRILRAAKTGRAGERHIQRAKAMATKARAEVTQTKRQMNSNKQMV